MFFKKLFGKKVDFDPTDPYYGGGTPGRYRPRKQLLVFPATYASYEPPAMVMPPTQRRRALPQLDLPTKPPQQASVATREQYTSTEAPSTSVDANAIGSPITNLALSADDNGNIIAQHLSHPKAVTIEAFSMPQLTHIADQKRLSATQASAAVVSVRYEERQPLKQRMRPLGSAPNLQLQASPRQTRKLHGGAAKSLLTAATSIGNVSVEQVLPGCIADAPQWLRVYALAPSHTDHFLEWHYFTLSELEQYNDALHKLYKQHVVRVALNYERLRQSLQKERERRMLQRQQRHSTQHSATARSNIFRYTVPDDDGASEESQNQVTVNVLGATKNTLDHVQLK